MTYSERADAVYVQLAEVEVARTKQLDDRRMIDLAQDGTVVGVEFLDASTGIDLTDIPSPNRIHDAVRKLNFPVFA